ncbi:MAG: ABC-type transport auxiliary lipoprotein family protein [Pseudomonadota bacterium]
MTQSPLAAAMLAALLLPGCAGLASLNSAATPSELYILTPKSTFSTGLPYVPQQIVVEEPTATAAVATDRISVHPSPLRVQSFPGVRWVDRAPVIVQSLLIQSFENSGRVSAVGATSVGLREDYTVVPELREFQAEVPVIESSGSPPLSVRVRINIKILDSLDERIIASRSFEDIEVAASDDMDDVAEAFDEALGDVMRDIVEWSVRRIASHAAGRS